MVEGVRCPSMVASKVMDVLKRILKGGDKPLGGFTLTSLGLIPLRILGAVIMMKTSSMYAKADGMAMPISLARMQSVGASRTQAIALASALVWIEAETRLRANGVHNAVVS